MTTPSGKLMWGQAGAYDGIDDRRVIAAVTRNRTGMTWPPTITVGSGLTMTVKGGWLGIVACGDGTSAVVGSPTDQNVTGLVGPASGSRTDYIWCDVQPDSGTWSLTVINATAAAGRSGLALATLTVPANASQASQFTIVSTDSTLERRLLGIDSQNDTNTRTASTWASAVSICSVTAQCQPGQWYRVRWHLISPYVVAGQLDYRVGVGWKAAGAAESTATLMRASNLYFAAVGKATECYVDWVYRYDKAAAIVSRTYVGRMWMLNAGGQYKVGAPSSYGDLEVLTVEDLGS